MIRLFLFAFLLSGAVSFGQLNRYSFQQTDSLQVNIPKPLFIFLHTDWCTYCRLMETSTFADQILVSYLNQHFYVISFNAESKAAVQFRGKNYKFRPTGRNTGYHELPNALTNSETVYPTILILDGNKVLKLAGFYAANDLLRALKSAEY